VSNQHYEPRQCSPMLAAPQRRDRDAASAVNDAFGCRASGSGSHFYNALPPWVGGDLHY
jgi:hypothetical protein